MTHINTNSAIAATDQEASETVQAPNISSTEGADIVAIAATEIGCGDNVTKSTPCQTTTVWEVIQRVQGDSEIKDRVAAIRANKLNPKAAVYLKKTLPFVLWSATMNGSRKKSNFAKATGLLGLDFDHLGENIPELKKKIGRDPHVAIVFESPSGEGLKVVIRVPLVTTADEHDRIHESAAAYFASIYGLNADPACRDISRACFLSHDPEIIFNPKAAELKVPAPIKRFKAPKELQTTKPGWRMGFDGDISSLKVQEFIQELGLGMRPTPAREWNGKLAIPVRCPWSDEHTGGVDGDTSTVIIVSMEGQCLGFKCLHGHCDHRTILHLLTWAESQKPGVVDRLCTKRRAERYHLTELGNARRLIDYHGEDLRFLPVKGWLAWDGTRWRRDENGEAMRRMKNTIQHVRLQASKLDDPADRNALIKWAATSESSKSLEGSLKLANTELDVIVSADDLDRDIWHLNCKNGTIDLRTENLLPHKRDDLITRTSGLDFDQSALCPGWEAFLLQASGQDPELVGFIQRALGYSLTADVKEQVLFFVYGPGGTGKTTLIEGMRSVCGEYAQQADFTTLLGGPVNGPRHDLARMSGHRFITAVEVDRGQKWAAATVKQLTGGDRIAARRLYGELTEFRFEGKLWLASNHRPEVSSSDDAMWRRILVIPFLHSVPQEKRDRTLRDRLREEERGILAWAVRGCRQWQEQGLNPPLAVVKAGAAYRDAQRDVERFFVEKCERVINEKISSTEIYESYFQWMVGAGAEPLSQKGFSSEMERMGVKKRRSSKHVAFIGIRLR